MHQNLNVEAIEIKFLQKALSIPSHIKKGITTIASLLLITCCSFAQKETNSYEPNWPSLSRHTEVPEWIRDAKFGIYTHWGVYTVPAYDNEQYYYFMHQDSGYDKMGTYRRQVDLYGPLSKFGYHDFIPMFKGEKFNADEWAELYKKSGAKFAGTVGEHHDGFSMWDSKLTPFNAKNMGPKRDVVGELEKAVRARGMKFFVSLHHEINYTYVKVKQGWAANNPKYAKLYGCLMPHDEWLKMWLGKCNEVVDKYHPDIMYFDAYMDQIPEKYIQTYLAHYFNEAKKRDQDAIVTYKNNDMPAEVGMLDHENSNPDVISEKPWLSDYAIGTGYHYSWGYVEGMQIRSARNIIHKLIEIVSNNGTMVLNLSPKADGTFPRDQKDVIANVGVWLYSYGESIYGTRPFVVSKEITSEGFRVHYTRKGKNVYAIFLDWPTPIKPDDNKSSEDKKLLLTKLTKQNLGGNVKAVNVLGLKELANCKFTSTNDGLSFTIPAKTRMPSDLAFAVRIELE
jgi:alpha-L-fucosidase